MQAHDLPFSKLINVDQGAREHFHVPKYQREYSWGKAAWEQLLLDIDDNDQGYFMGSIICVNNTQELRAGDEFIFEVVDGQQRLTTLSLLLMAVYSNLSIAKENTQFEDDDDRVEVEGYLTNIKAKLIKRKKDAKTTEPGVFWIGKNAYFLRVQPSAQNHNLADYRFLLSEAGIIDAQPKPPHCGNRVLSRGYNFFRQSISKDIDGLLSLIKKINDLIFVQITVGSQADAFTLFESLNNRGVPLSAIDIIKNKILGQMERKHKVDIDESFDRWQTIIAALQDPNEQERFLRHFYNAFKHRNEIQVERATRATRSQIIRIYETLIERNAELLFGELTEKAKIYAELLRPEHSTKSLAAGLEELGRIGSTPAYQLLLYLFSLEPSNFSDSHFLQRTVDLLTRYFVRRNITDFPPTREMDQAMIHLAEACATRVGKKQAIEQEWFVQQLLDRAKPSSLTQFIADLNDSIYEYNPAMTRYVLIQIDQKHHGHEYQPDFWARDERGRFVWTVEHVLPQAEKLPPHWVKMIADGDKAEAEEIQSDYVHRLGNLTLSGYNSDLATSPFERKQRLVKDRSFLGHKINIGYKNGLKLNNLTFRLGADEHSLATSPTWNAETISARTEILVREVVKANLLPGEKMSDG